MNRITRAAVTLAAIFAVALAGQASAHQAKSIQGTVDCDGNYAITVNADVWGGVHLIVKLDGAKIYDEAIPGNDQSVHAFGPFTGTGATAGMSISAKTSDNASGASGVLVADPSECVQPTEPPATEPPATEPPATEPPATEPPATVPPQTQPPVLPSFPTPTMPSTDTAGAATVADDGNPVLLLLFSVLFLAVTARMLRVDRRRS